MITYGKNGNWLKNKNSPPTRDREKPNFNILIMKKIFNLRYHNNIKDSQ